MTPTEVQTLVLDYFKSWQIRDWDLMERCLAPDFKFNAGVAKFDSAAPFLDMCRKGPDWESVNLIESVFTESMAALLYEGRSLPDNSNVRAAEIIKCEGGRIKEAQVVFTVLS